jgi:PhnB protein
MGESKVMLADEFPEMCDGHVKAGEKIGAPSTIEVNSVFLNMYFENVDDVFERAKMEGATVIMPLMDAFWGDRYGQFRSIWTCLGCCHSQKRYDKRRNRKCG